MPQPDLEVNFYFRPELPFPPLSVAHLGPEYLNSLRLSITKIGVALVDSRILFC